MSTAVGSLDYVVVETAVDAQHCVEHLRRTGGGVATFLMLEKQRHLERAAAEKGMKTPEGGHEAGLLHTGEGSGAHYADQVMQCTKSYDYPSIGRQSKVA